MLKNLENFDAIVLGGGPGGSTAAGFLAKQGLKVVLFEKEKFPRYHIGESLLPATTMGVLNKLGVKNNIDKYGFPKKMGGTFRWGKDDEPWTFRFYRTDAETAQKKSAEPRFLHSYQVRRAEFDQILLDHARGLGAEVHEESSCAAIEGVDEAVKTVVVDQKDGARRRFRAPFVVDASGRGSIARQLFGERRYDPFFENVAVFGYFEGGKRLPGERKGNIFCEAFPNGWFWYIPVSDEITSVGVVMDKKNYSQIKAMAPEKILRRMIDESPRVKEMLARATPCRKAPYDRLRVEADYSYAHTEFARNGVFLVGDAACFIDPVFSSGVHLATYSGYLAAEAIRKARARKSALKPALAEFERLYRKEYRSFHRFLISFYEMHQDTGSYFWAARKVLARKNGSDLDAFISIVSGTSTTGGKLLEPGGSYSDEIRLGRKSLETLVKKVSGRKVSKADFEDAKGFMQPIHESRMRFLEKTPKS